MYHNCPKVIEEEILKFFQIFVFSPFLPLSVQTLNYLWDAEVLTGLISCDADCSKLSWWWAQLWHPVNGIDFKGVVSVCQEICHCHRGVGESKLSREEADIWAAWLTLFHIPPTFFTYDVEGNIFPASCVQGPAPVQDNRGLVYIRDNISWCRWRSCKVVQQRLMSLTSGFYCKGKRSLTMGLKWVNNHLALLHILICP